MKDYLKKKINLDNVEIIIMFKNQVMPDSYKMDEIDQLYGFDQEKNIFTYARKEAITQDNAINNNNTATI